MRERFSIIGGGSVLEYGSDFDGGHVTISASTNALKDNLTKEALSRRMVNRDIEKVSKKVKFGMGTWKEYINYNDEIPHVLKGFFGRGSGDTLAVVTHKRDGTFDCYFSVDKILKYTDELNLGKETKQAKLVRMIDECWVHEREHLLQYMRPKVAARMNEDFKHYSKLYKIALASSAIGASFGISSLFVIAAPIAPFLSIAGALMASGGLTLKEITLENQSFKSPYEQEAYITQSDEIIDSPFKVIFENY